MPNKKLPKYPVRMAYPPTPLPAPDDLYPAPAKRKKRRRRKAYSQPGDSLSFGLRADEM